ncbi:IS3 family transposase [Algivirga pacifica]|uniref:IS3 family transposase n=1 Tax=Algivirga pacifica TaxID=1162670 RepID=UPI0031E96935
MTKKKVWDRRSKKDLVDHLYTKYKGSCSFKQLLQWVGLAESSYYYKEKGGKKGNKASSHTKHSTDGLIPNEQVVDQVRIYLEHPFIDYGYHNLCALLKRDGYVINHKKLYRLLKEANLLKNTNRIRPDRSNRKFVKFRRVNAQYPMEYLEMDIKMVWIPEKGKYAYLLSVIDVYSRRILGHVFQWSVKQADVVKLISDIIEQYRLPKEVIIRSDNGSQFIAKEVREYLALVGVSQEFTHVATPEENAHIEAYHGTLRRDIFLRFEYRTFGEIEQILDQYVIFYNQERLHGMIGRIPPMERWNHYFEKMATVIQFVCAFQQAKNDSVRSAAS